MFQFHIFQDDKDAVRIANDIGRCISLLSTEVSPKLIMVEGIFWQDLIEIMKQIALLG